MILDRRTNKAQFPPSSVDQSVLTKTDTHSPCPWKGEASYYSIKVDGTVAFFDSITKAKLTQ